VGAPPGLRRTLRGLPPAAWALYAGTFINRFGSFVVTFLILYLIKQGYSAAAAGMAVGAYGLGSLAAGLVGGVFADRLGRRTSIAISMFTSAAILLLLSQARHLVLIMMLTALAGLTAEMYRPASGALLADLLPAQQRVTAFALYRLAINAGFAFGPAAAGFLADRSFFWLFLGDALTSVVFGVIALVALPEGTRSHAAAERRGESLRAILADRAFLLFLVASVAVAFVYFQSTSTFPLHVRASGLSNAAFGTLISLNGLIIVFLELPLTTVTQRLAPRPVIAVGMLLVGAGFGLTALAHTYPLLVVTVLIWTLGEIIGAPVSSAYVANIAPAHLRGRYQGAWGMTWGLAFILGPVLGTRLFSVSPGGFWALCAALGAAAAGLVLSGPGRAAAAQPAGAPNAPLE
jgi:MFS family permease